MPKININLMTIEDINAISSNLSSDFDDFWNINQLESELNNPDSYCYIAKKENEIIAFIAIWKVIDVVHLNNIVVKKNLRNLGIGTLLLEHVINICNNFIDVNSITLEVYENNTTAIQLYEKFDFKKVGIRKNYYGQNKNAIIMTKIL